MRQLSDPPVTLSP